MHQPTSPPSASPIVPCLWLDDQAEAAARFYTEVFPRGEVHLVSHYPETIDNPSQKPRGSVLTVEFEVAGQRFTALNGGPHFTINPSISFFVMTSTAEETNRLADALGVDGKVLMQLDRYPWSERYGWVQDRFGVSWQIMTTDEAGQGPMIVPCLMFANAQFGRAEEAIRMYTGLFPNSAIGALSRNTADQGPEGKIALGRFSLSGQAMAAMDSHGAHGFDFDEGLSLQVMCEDQATVDRYWAALSDGGSEGPCGWLKDRFGVSWQVVPAEMVDWMTCSDAVARDRAFQAMMGMKKLDVAALKAAYTGR